MDRFRSMEIFMKAADAGSFTAAAAGLGMSAQMIGKHIAALETELGAPLLRRTTRRQSLTDVGEMFYAQCRAILAETDAAYRLVQNMSTTPSGRLRISAPANFGACALAPVMTRFLDSHPNIQVELLLTDRYVDLVDEGFDAAIRLGPIDGGGLVARELIAHTQVACASPDYLAAHGEPDTPEDLVTHACLAYVNWSGRPYAEWRFTQAGKPRTVQVRSRFQVNDGRVLLAAAIEGQGIVLQPSVVLREAIATGRLVPILTAYQAPSRPMYLVFLPRQPQPPKLRALIDCVVAAFGPSTVDGP